jgi:peptide deformylase
MHRLILAFLLMDVLIYESNVLANVNKGEAMLKASINLPDSTLPNYVAADVSNLIASQNTSIRMKSKTVNFPLSHEDKRDVDIVIRKFDSEKNISGLAAPQIGITKRIIIFAVPDDPELKKWRPDLTQAMPKTLWLNPSYKPIGDLMHEDYEGCFSVKDTAGLVKRFKKISYKAFSIDGEIIEGEAEGFAARVIQHEIDHLDGKLFIDLIDKDHMLSIEEYRKLRAEKMNRLGKA